MYRNFLLLLSLMTAAMPRAAAQAPMRPPPIIDVHVHALAANSLGRPPVPTCAADLIYLPRDPSESYSFEKFAACDAPLQSPESNEELMKRTFDIMERYNVTGVVSGPLELVRRWKAAAPDRVIPGLTSSGQIPVDSIRKWAADGLVRVLGELTFQYAGLSPSDPIEEQYFTLAEQMDLPVGVHVGLGPPGAAYVGFSKYRMRMSDPLQFEDVLIRHPKLRLYIMHAGWPLGDQMIGLLYAHPQVYVDIGVIDWFVPRKEFHAYLKRLVDAGFGQRIMFGSDQMIWPEAMRIAIEGLESADFLSAAQKRDILYNNAVRFFRLSSSDVVRK